MFILVSSMKQRFGLANGYFVAHRLFVDLMDRRKTNADVLIP
jgi:hypothetical protein